MGPASNWWIVYSVIVLIVGLILVVATGGHAGLILRLALRELRGGLRGFYVFLACIALGVLAIAAVGSLAHGLADGLAKQGQADGCRRVERALAEGCDDFAAMGWESW